MNNFFKASAAFVAVVFLFGSSAMLTALAATSPTLGGAKYMGTRCLLKLVCGCCASLHNEKETDILMIRETQEELSDFRAALLSSKISH